MTDYLWRCTVCGRVGTVGRCCGEETRERVNMEQLLAEHERLRAEVERLAEALKCMIIGACAVAVPHNGERAVLQDAVNIARAALRERLGEGGPQ